MSSAPPNDLPQPPAAAIAPPPAEAVIAPAAAPGRATGVGITHLLLGVVAAAALASSVMLWQKLTGKIVPQHQQSFLPGFAR